MNILFPEISVFLDEGFHHLNAVRILEETHSDALLSHDLFSEGREVDILSHQNSVKLSVNKCQVFTERLGGDGRFDLVEERGPSAHYAGRQCRDQGESVPVRSPASVPRQ